MKKNNLLLCICILMSIHSFAQDLYLYQVDPLEKVLKDRSYFEDQMDTIRVARGETASVQIVIKTNSEIKDMSLSVSNISDGKNSITAAEPGWVNYVKVGRKYPNPSKDLLRTPSDYFPDPIITGVNMNLPQNDIQPVWITALIPNNTVPGIYKGTVRLTGKVSGTKKTWEKDFYVRVYPVTVNKPSLLVTNWSDHHSQRALKLLNNGEEIENFSDLYWEIVQKHAEIMASHGQNVHRIYPVWSTKMTIDKNGKYTFDFTNFDKELKIFERLGALERIEGGHLTWRRGDWTSPFYLDVPLPDDAEAQKYGPSLCPFKQEKGIRRVYLPVDDPRTHNFISQFLPALKKHLEEQGWLDKYIQHIGDEPIIENAESYRKISDYVRQYLPGVKIVDAILISKELENSIDIWVPILDLLHRDFAFYQDLQKKGKEVWHYTCLNPQWNYANRFIELPLIQTRYLHWINYKYNITGYLHWGLNYWDGVNPLTGDASRDITLPAGDNWIIYPGYRKLYSSIRFEAMRDGIYDYELLKMLEKKHPGYAKEHADVIIRDFNEYDSNILFFRVVRKRILEQLSQ